LDTFHGSVVIHCRQSDDPQVIFMGRVSRRSVSHRLKLVATPTGDRLRREPSQSATREESRP
jgi:hypothetical protein